MNKQSRPSLMVALRDLDRSSRGFLFKAGQIARHMDAKLNVVHVISMPYAQTTLDIWAVTQATLDSITASRKKQLEKLVEPIRQAGIDITYKVVWGYPPIDSLVRETAKSKPDLLLVKTDRHSRVGRWFLTNTDWELIRRCTCPLWLVKSSKFSEKPLILAAVDPFHRHEKPARLDRKILDTAQRLAGRNGRIGICHAFETPQKLVGALDQMALIPLTPKESARHRIRITRSVDRLVGAGDIARKDRFVVEGEPGKALTKIAKSWRADLLVMGAVSRSTLKRIFIGNTAERVLDAVNCDVVVVK